MGNCMSRSTSTEEEVSNDPQTSGSAPVVVVTNRQQTPISEPATPVEEFTNKQQTPVSVSTDSASTVEEVTNSQQTPVSKPAPTVQDVIDSLKAVSETTHLEEFVRVIKLVLEEKKKSVIGSTSESAKEDKGSTIESAEENKGMWKLFVTRGAKFLKFVNEHTEKIEKEKDWNSGLVAEILGQMGQFHWAVAGLSILAYVIEKCDKVSANKEDVLELLSNMVDLAPTLVKLRDVIPEEEDKLKKAVIFVVKGSIMCVCQIYSKKLFRFLRESTNSENLKKMSKSLDHLYSDLNLATTAVSGKRQNEIARKESKRLAEIERRQSIVLPVPKPFYPNNAVGIENEQEQLIQLLRMTTEDESALAVVVFGFGGIGKTTLATSVVAMLNFESYNYARVYLQEDQRKNNFEKMQLTVLQDAFPNFNSGAPIVLRDSQEGRDRLQEAFQCAEKPIFLFIDNALRSEDVQDLLPEDLSGLPKRSRILVTTRTLKSTDAFLSNGIKRYPFPMKTLRDEHAEQMLRKDLENPERINDDDMKRMVRICGGVPLALRIVRAQLVKMGCDAAKCRQILDSLEKGKDVKEENLSDRLINFVYNELEDETKEAFLDICCFFDGGIRRVVEYVVGAEEVKALEEAALLTFTSPDKDDYEAALHCCIAYFLLLSGDEQLNVHDIVRAKGRAMSASTRFRDVESFKEAAQDETKLNEIKGLKFEEDVEYELDVKHLNMMKCSLRILIDVKTSAQSPMIFRELRFLSLVDNFPHLPMKIEKLDMLRIYTGPTPRDFIMKIPKSLLMMISVLNKMTCEDSSAAQDIQKHSLEQLYLTGDWYRYMEPKGLHQLCKLKILQIVNVRAMERFPKQICKVSPLTILKIDGWPQLKHLSQSFGQLKGLTCLQILDCHELEKLPSSFGKLTALKILYLNCKKLKQLPTSFGELTSLKFLYIEDCQELRRLPSNFGKLIALERLYLENCPKLKLLPSGLESLQNLNVKGCKHLNMEFYQNKLHLIIVKEDKGMLEEDENEDEGMFEEDNEDEGMLEEDESQSEDDGRFEAANEDVWNSTEDEDED